MPLFPTFICVDLQEDVSKNSHCLSKELVKNKVMSSLRIKQLLQIRKMVYLVGFIVYLKVCGNYKAHEHVLNLRGISITVALGDLGVH